MRRWKRKRRKKWKRRRREKHTVTDNSFGTCMVREVRYVR